MHGPNILKHIRFLSQLFANDITENTLRDRYFDIILFVCVASSENKCETGINLVFECCLKRASLSLCLSLALSLRARASGVASFSAFKII